MNRAHAKIIERIEESGEDLIYYLAQLANEEIGRIPAPNEWSIHAVIAHMRDTEQQIFLKRVKRILSASAPPAVENFDQEQWNREHYRADEPMSKIVAEMKAARLALLKLLKKTTDKDWKRWAVHPDYGKISIEWLAMHEYNHTVEHLHQVLDRREQAMLGELNP